MPNLGTTELLLILGIVILIFGASRLPAIGRGLGETISGFRNALKDDSDQDNGAAAIPSASLQHNRPGESSQP